MLKDIRIVDFSQYLPGPYASLRLADRGAEVIKVESPSGDPSRFPPEKDNGDKYIFRAQNRDKKSITINLKESNGKRIARELIKQSDVVVEGFRPGVAKRLGIGYEEVSKDKPDIIYCSLTGYGQNGEFSHLGSHDLNYMSLSGVLSQFKDHKGEPVHPSITLADFIGGMAASESISAALFQRERTGKGAYIDLSIADTMFTLMTNHVALESTTGEENGISKLNKEVICYSLYKTKDNRFISLAALEPKFWENFCQAVKKQEWISAQLTVPNDENPVYLALKELFKSHTLEKWIKFAEEVDCCMAPVLEISEVSQHSYYKERNLSEEKWGMRYVSTFYKDESIIKNSTPPPKHGEHTNELLKKLDTDLIKD
ncbi:CaiB/BaiF CoA transferase family protein [Salinibacillus xinjiangensis]|uniref:CoA transferase n=1 Tax=Salinibacillus xinjiangensis TaxID=1229268 RepID=A0A6G1X1N9_9BACI|nr:CaiB/BaiF CoA-transferase family protein [Salinibacillus xinjiangensis]MRG84859.1 CoA transferase [Salinibacillus xinjiangensis]